MRSVLRLFALVALCLLPTLAFADVIEMSYTFDTPVLSQQEDGSVEVVLNGLQRHLTPGEPILPQHTARLLIPQGHEVVDVTISSSPAITLATTVTLLHAPAYRYTGSPADEGYLAVPKAEIYQGTSPFPREAYRPLHVQGKMGAQILPVVLFPVTWQPQTGALEFTPQMTVTVTTQPTKAARPLALSYRGLAADDREILNAVDNPHTLLTYLPAKSLGKQVDMLILAPTNFLQLCEQYAQYKEDTFGITVQVDDLNNVADMPGVDAPMKVRNYLRQQYEQLGIRFVLLVGDADLGRETLPVRKVFAVGTDPDDGAHHPTNLMISDVYYGCLDGSWNGNGNDKYGEDVDGESGGDVDLMFDVHVGRFMVDNVNELQNTINKHMQFDGNPAPRKVVFVGEEADSLSSGGVMKEEVYKYTNEVDVTRLYDVLHTCNFSHVLQAINSNEHQWLNHMGHADLYMDMFFMPPMVSRATNTTLFIGYTQGCYAGSFDGRMGYDIPMGIDSIVEFFTFKTPNFAFAYIANTRFGFYLQGRVDGPSNVYDWEFADAIFSENIANIGWANDDSREDCIGMLSYENMMRYVFYEITLFGDPHTPLRFVDDPIDDDDDDDDDDATPDDDDDDDTLDDDATDDDTTDDDAIDDDDDNDNDDGCGC